MCKIIIIIIINDLSKELQQISVNLEYNESNGKANNKIYTDIDEECPTVHQQTQDSQGMWGGINEL